MNRKATTALTLGTCAVLAAVSITAGPQAVAGGKSKWTKVSSQDVSLINEAGLLRLDDNKLLIVYSRQAANNSESIGYTQIKPGGAKAGTGTVVSGWDALTNDPKPIRINGGRVAVVFSGIRGGPPGSTYNAGSMYSASAGAKAGSWSLDTTGLSSKQTAYASSGTGAITRPGGMPMVSFPVLDSIYWRQGFNPSIPSTGSDNEINNGGCCAYHSTLAQDAKSNQTYVAWYSNASGANKNGTFVRRLLPSSGPKIKVPKSSKGSSSLNPDQAVAMTGRMGAAGVFVAFCDGYPTCKRMGLWRIGTKKVRTVPHSRGADTTAIAPGPGGRLWILWENNQKVFAVHTNKKATRFGAVRSVRAPGNSFSIYRMSGEGSANRGLDVVINNGRGLFHTQVRPGLKLTASPRKFDGDRRTRVTFKVTDAGQAVAGAKVKAGGKSDRTNKKGVARITFGGGTKAGKIKAVATKPSFYRGQVVLKVLR